MSVLLLEQLASIKQQRTCRGTVTMYGGVLTRKQLVRCSCALLCHQQVCHFATSTGVVALHDWKDLPERNLVRMQS